MKKITLFPICCVNVTCPYCQNKGNIKFERPPVKDILAKCPKCKEDFKIIVNIRENSRKNVAISVLYSFKDFEQEDAKAPFSGEIVDLSLGGMGVESSDAWLSDIKNKEGKILTFVFSLPPKNEVLKVKGLIRRIYEVEEEGKFGIGVSFADLDDEISKKIGFFLWSYT